MVDTNRQDASLSQLERESERTRAQLADTVDELRTRVSPAALKQDVRDYVRHTREEFFHNVERRARENPLQAVAIAAGLAYPAWRIVRSIPAPILLIGAGLALARPSLRAGFGNGHEGTGEPGLLDQVRDRVEGATEAVKEKARQAADSVQQAVSNTKEQISGAKEQISGTAERLQSAVSSRVASVRSGVAEAAGGTTDAVRDAGAQTSAALSAAREQAAQAGRRAQDSLTRAQDGLADAIERHPLVVGGIGLFIGAAIAAAIPASRAENRLLGDTSDELKNRARDLASQGYETAKAAADNVYEAGKRAAEEQGLTPGAVREALQDLGEKATTAHQRATGGGDEQSQSQPNGGRQNDGGQSQSQRFGAAGLDAKY
jgi:ElaB/YqjD/DUF883 family membrane-anchored ribosome-binding protein